MLSWWSLCELSTFTLITLLTTSESSIPITEALYETLCICQLEKCKFRTFYGGPESEFKRKEVQSTNFRNDFRFHVLIVIHESSNYSTCSGTMLNDRWLVTTRTCFTRSNITYDMKSKKFDFTQVAVVIQRVEKQQDWNSNTTFHRIENFFTIPESSGDLILLRLVNYQVITPTIFTCLPGNYIHEPGLWLNYFAFIIFQKKRMALSACRYKNQDENSPVTFECYFEPTDPIDHGSPITYHSASTKYHVLSSLYKDWNFRSWRETHIFRHTNWIIFQISHSV